MVSSRNITISCPKNLMRHGLVAKCILGTLFLIRAMKDDNNGRRGRTEFPVMSRGPGTKTTFELRVIVG
jgi:hypothetical protein